MAKRCSAAPFDLFRSSHDGRPREANDVDGAAKAEPGTGGASGTALKPCADDDEEEEEDELAWDARAGLGRGGDRRLGGDADRSRPNGPSGSSIGSNSSIDRPRGGPCWTGPIRCRDDDDGGADGRLPWRAPDGRSPGASLSEAVMRGNERVGGGESSYCVIGSNSSIDGPREGVCRTEPPRLRDDDDDDDDEGGADSRLP